MFMHPRCDICRGFGERDANELFGTKCAFQSFTSHLTYIVHFQGTGEKDITLTHS